MVDFDKDRDANLSAFERTGGAAHGGLTVRDYFAAQAIGVAAKAWKQNVAGAFGEGDSYVWDDSDWRDVADKAYDIADAMMEARQCYFNDPSWNPPMVDMVTVEEAFGFTQPVPKEGGASVMAQLYGEDK